MRMISNTNNDLTSIRQLIHQGWNEVAAEYTKDRLGIFRRYAGRLLDLLRPPIDSKLLDVGCGSGVVALQAKTRLGSNGWVIGSDIAAAMLHQGRTKALHETSNVTFCQMDAQRLGFANISFDCVTCAFSLFQFQDMVQALAEMWRVLKPGGQLGLSNWGVGYFTPIASLQRELFRKFRIRPLLTNPLVFKPTELHKLLALAGFTMVEIVEESDEIWFISPEEVWAFNMDMGPFPIMLRQQISTDQQRELKHQFMTMLEKLMTKRGIKSTFHLLYAVAKKGVTD
jgi:ubiquinone/menaquinone biosynthesis C-methylase UbiE